MSFELAAWDKDKNHGMIVRSSLSRPQLASGETTNTQVFLSSLVFYVEKKEGKSVTERVWVFNSEIDESATIEGLNDAGGSLTLKNLFEDTSKNVLYKKAQEYKWTSGGTQSIFDKIKISKDGKKALFFGRDFSGEGGLEAKLKAVYKQGEKWKEFDYEGATTKTITQSLFSGETKGIWTIFTKGK